MAVCPNPKPRGFSTICLPVSKERYLQVIDSPALYRQWLGEAFRATPELFPAAFASGYTLKDDRVSAKCGLRLRRIRCKADGTAFSVRPSFVPLRQVKLGEGGGDVTTTPSKPFAGTLWVATPTR